MSRDVDAGYHAGVRLVARRLASLLLLLVGACADDPSPGTSSPCDQSVGALLGCEPPATSSDAPTIEAACSKLVRCGAFLLERPEDYGDYAGCIDRLRGNDFPAARLEYALRCVQIATCQDLVEDHCLLFGGDPPQP